MMKFPSTTLSVALFVAILSPLVVVAEDTLTLFKWETIVCDHGFPKCGTLEYCVRTEGGVGYRQLVGNTPVSDCLAPGPLIRVTPGQRYLLTLKHNVPGPDPTNIHTHGLHIGGSGNEDDITREAHFGNCLKYNWTVPSFHTGGTYWYHAHAHEYTAQQVGDGAFGMIVVEDTDDIFAGITNTASIDNIRSFLNNDKALVIAKVGNSWYGNGVPEATQASLKINTNEWTRLRVSISEATAAKKDLQITGCDDVRVISYDGVPRSEIPSDPVTTVTLTGASRVDLAIKCSAGEADVVYGNTVAARLVVSGSGDGTITPFADGVGATWNPFRPAYLEDMLGLQPNLTYEATMTASQINGKNWDAVTPLLTYGRDQVFEWTLSGTNAHPFHLHLYHMQIKSAGGCGHHEPGEWYDTISARGDCVVRFRTNDIGGRCVLHCHVLSHEDNGSMHWINVTGFPPASTMDPPAGESSCPTAAPVPTAAPSAFPMAAPTPTGSPPTLACSGILNKSDCIARPDCNWNNRLKVCQ